MHSGMPGKELGALKRNGVQLTRPVDTPEIAISGDTTIEGVVVRACMGKRSTLLKLTCQAGV